MPVASTKITTTNAVNGAVPPLRLALGRAVGLKVALVAAAAAAGAGGPAGENTAQLQGKQRFSATVYNGDVIPQCWGCAIADMDTMVLPDFKAGQTLPVLLNHGSPYGMDANTWSNIGLMDSAEIGDGGTLSVKGQFLSNDTAKRVIADAQDGFPWELSLRTTGGEMEYVAPGATAKVNGREVTGPVYVVRNAVLREVSFVQLGADDDTAAELEASQTGDKNNGTRVPLAVLARLPENNKMSTENTTATLLAGLTIDQLKTGRPDLIAAIAAASPVSGAGAATVAELKALPGASSDFIVASVEAGHTRAQAVDALLASMHNKVNGHAAELAAKLAEQKTAHDEVVSGLTARLKLAEEAAGVTPVKGSAANPGVTAAAPGPGLKLAGVQGTDPEADWNNSPQLQACWKDHGGKQAFIAYAGMQARAGDKWDTNPFA